MKHILQPAASVAASTVASILATWLLRRIIYSSETMKTEQPGEQHAPVWVFMPMVILIGNTVIPGRRGGRFAMRKHRRG